MRRFNSGWKALGLLAIIPVVALAISCENTPVSAPGDGQIVLAANPTTITLDENVAPQVLTGSTLISAQFFNASGVPLSGVDVIFSTDGGVLASVPPGQPAQAIESDGNGFVSDTLSVGIGDPDDITVTVRSGTLSGNIAITKFERPANQPPFADIFISPQNSAILNEGVTFDGSGSSDPDGDAITCYQWTIKTSESISSPALACTPANPRCEIAQGAFLSALSRTYNQEQTVQVELRVTDDPTIVCNPIGPVEPESAFNALAVANYEIVCDRSNPVASAGPNQVISLNGGSSISVGLSGVASIDSESAIIDYQWNCGNGTTFSGVSGNCTYTSAGTFSATLVVTNSCGLLGQDTAVITVSP